jgi:hypothetical protein
LFSAGICTWFLGRCRGAATLLLQEKKKCADVQRSRVNFTRVKRGVIRVRVIMAAADCIPAVASRRVNYAGDFRIQTLPGVHSRDRKISSSSFFFFSFFFRF